VSVVFIVRDYAQGAARFFDLEGDQVADVSRKMAAGEVVIGTVLSQRIGVNAGEKITLETAQGPREVTVAALTNEYMVGGLAVYLDRKVGKELLNVEGTDAFIIRTTPDQRAQVKAQLQKIADSHGVLLYSFAEVRHMIEGMIIGIEGCLWGVIVLGFVIATFGVVNTLTMNVLEQTREIGLLRVVAMTRDQVRKTIFGQAALVGLLGLLPGTLAGIIVSYINHLASMPATGHPVPFGFHPVMLSVSFVVGLLLVVLASWFPAERAARLELVTSLRTT
jgi:putative ABC transport system permease protein